MPSVNDFLVDFSKEDDSGGGARFKPGTYKVKIVGAKTGVSEQQGTKYLAVTFAFLEGNYRKQKKKMVERLYITPKALRRFRLLLQAVDMKVPAKLDAAKLAGKLKGKDLYIEIEDDEREGYKTRSTVGFEGFINEDDYDPEAAEEEDEDEEDLDEEDEDEDLDEDEEEEDEDEEEEEEEPEPPKRKKGKAKPAAKKKSKKAKDDEDEDDDLSELDLDEL